MSFVNFVTSKKREIKIENCTISLYQSQREIHTVASREAQRALVESLFILLLLFYFWIFNIYKYKHT